MKLLVLTAPSGAGKTTIARRLMAEVPGLRFSVSATTRDPREGEALRDDLAARADALEALVAAVEARAPERTAEARARLHERLDDLVGAGRLEPGRLEAEVALLADKLDVTEEAVRLRSHLGQFRAALAETEPVGRRLNFLTQEIGREANTVGSKANDADLTRLAVAMKEEVEKIREQVQNVV